MKNISGIINVKHQSLELNWDDKIIVDSPQTLVLGSFNPFKNSENIVDYYYGRQTNHFWKSIAIINNLNELWFFDEKNGIERKKKIMDKTFVCFDVIESIEISSNDLEELSKYVDVNIFNNFSDSKIWTSKTQSKNGVAIYLKRTYNQNVIDYLQENNSVNKIIHTMGSNRLKMKPQEKKFKENGFNGYMNQILEICKSKNIEFVFESLSPSDYAVKTGKVIRTELQFFFKSNIPFDV